MHLLKRVKNRDNLLFSNELAQLIHTRDAQWSIARKTNNSVDWQRFRTLRNKCTSAIRNAKSNYYLILTNDCTANHSKFWKTIKVLQNKKVSDFPQQFTIGKYPITDKLEMLNAFNSHFEKAGHIFDQQSSTTSVDSSDCFISDDVPSSPQFDLKVFHVSDILKSLLSIDLKKAPRPDGLDPFLLKAVALVIAEPVTHIFNMKISLNQVSDIWKQAFFTPLFKAGDRYDVNN